MCCIPTLAAFAEVPLMIHPRVQSQETFWGGFAGSTSSKRVLHFPAVRRIFAHVATNQPNLPSPPSRKEDRKILLPMFQYSVSALIHNKAVVPQKVGRETNTGNLNVIFFELLVTALQVVCHPDLSLYRWSHHSCSLGVSISFETLSEMSPGTDRKGVKKNPTPFSRRRKIIFGKRSTMKLTQTHKIYCDIIILHSFSLNSNIYIYVYKKTV